jgi:hypothetical protein
MIIVLEIKSALQVAGRFFMGYPPPVSGNVFSGVATFNTSSLTWPSSSVGHRLPVGVAGFWAGWVQH